MRAVEKANLRLFFQEIEQPGSIIEKCVDHVWPDGVSGQAMEIKPGLLTGIMAIGRHGNAIKRHPHIPSRYRSRASEVRGFFEHQHAQSSIRRRECCTESRSPGADNHNIGSEAIGLSCSGCGRS